MERYFRVATAYGHYKANLDLRIMIGQGQAYSDDPVKETLDLTQELIDHKVPGGYYDMARYIKAGYGVKQDEELALKYYRKAADMGNPEAQYLLAERFNELDDQIAREAGLQMRRCAANQGHPKAAETYAIQMQLNGEYPEAVKYFQLATKFGEESGPAFLEDGFKAPPASDNLNYLGLPKDEERSRRYGIIARVLSDYSYAHPKVPELDDIVPLPPAKLPKWDGKLKWLEEFNSNVPPEKPDEALVERMAKAKNLDPKTGRPLQSISHSSQADAAPVPGAEAAPRSVALGTLCRSGETCPQSGQWQAVWPDGAVEYIAVRRIEAGQVFPNEEVKRLNTGLARLLSTLDVRVEPVSWKLIRHA
jgi:hypothetical protein